MMLAEEFRRTDEIDVRVIGIGGAGCASLVRVNDFLSSDVSMLAIDTGSAANNLPDRIESLLIGTGFGTGGDTNDASLQFAAWEPAVRDFAQDADVLIVLAGLGRGTGSALVPVVSELGKQVGALTIAAVNMPFEFEGRYRNRSAFEALQAVSAAADAVVVMNNDDLSKLGDSQSSLNGAFQLADQNVAGAVAAITSALQAGGERASRIYQSFADAGESAVLTGEATAGATATLKAFESTSARFARVNNAVVHVEGGIGLSLGQIAEVVSEVRNRIGRRAAIHISSERLVGMGQEMRVTLILAGIQKLGEPIQIDQQVSAPVDLPVASAGEPTFTSDPVRTRGPVLLPAS